MIYLDNAATSFPKPPEVVQAVCDYLTYLGGSARRSQHFMAVAAERVVHETRRDLARLINVPDAARVVFTLNATDALNTAIKGVLNRGDHVIVSGLEHNAVVRPLHRLAAEGIEFSRLPYSPTFGADPADVAGLIRSNTRLLVMTHASNVIGEILPVAALVAAAKEHGLLTLVDTSQTAGCVEIDVAAWGADLVALTGHKSLLGPQGVGALYAAEGVNVRPLREGGTGSVSQEPAQPDFWPDHLESGTLNGPGIAGFGAGIRWVSQRGVAHIRAEEARLTARLYRELASIPDVTVYGPEQIERRVGVVSFNIGDIDSVAVATQLEERFGIITRAGLHCAPWAHECLGTLRQGTVRLSLSPFTTDADIDGALEAVVALSHHE